MTMIVFFLNAPNFFKEVLEVLRREDYRRWILWEIFAIKVFNMTLTFLEFSVAAFHVT